MTARARILQRVRKAAADAADPADAADTAAGTGAPPPLRPALAAPDDPLAQFVARAEAVHATTSRLASLADLPAALADQLRQRNLPAVIRTGTDPAFDRDWGTLAHSTGPGRPDEPATLTRAEAGIAETGALVFTSGPGNPQSLNFLGETHFAVLATADILGGYEDAFARHAATTRTVTLVTGPSRSADIGQTLQLGAHGPVALHIFLVDRMEG